MMKFWLVCIVVGIGIVTYGFWPLKVKAENYFEGDFETLDVQFDGRRIPRQLTWSGIFPVFGNMRPDPHLFASEIQSFPFTFAKFGMAAAQLFEVNRSFDDPEISYSAIFVDLGEGIAEVRAQGLLATGSNIYQRFRHLANDDGNKTLYFYVDWYRLESGRTTFAIAGVNLSGVTPKLQVFTRNSENWDELAKKFRELSLNVETVELFCTGDNKPSFELMSELGSSC